MLREGRFNEKMNPEASEYTSSMKDDIRLFEAVTKINVAHVKMLSECGIISDSDSEEILNALSELKEEGIDSLNLSDELEDIHMAIEDYVVNKVGKEVGGKLHTAKSRNDQVSGAIRITLREEILDIQDKLIKMIESLMELAEENKDVIMPGHTHLQVAEPTTFAHHLNSYSWAFSRALNKLRDNYSQTNASPLGACALSGTSFPIDRELMSELLGFERLVNNTIDAVGTRDFVLQIMSNLSILMSNLGRLAEEILLWNSTEFDMIEIPDEYASTSSIMPQKKNPEVAEIARAKAGKSIGNLTSSLSIMKTLPQAYNLDLQEITPLLWNSIDEAKSSLRIMSKFIREIEPKPEKMLEHTEKGFSNATELADTLVRENDVSFREAHAIVGKLIVKALDEEKELRELTQEDLESVSQEVIDKEISLTKEKFEKALDLENCVEARKVTGGPSPEKVGEELEELENKMKEIKRELSDKRETLSKIENKLFGEKGS
ncbi:MAG: argininosuccinate lyase [Hadesarchaea archaeon]|nr:argininosuccinate lyase [Hadesarchaea archaeon]